MKTKREKALEQKAKNQREQAYEEIREARIRAVAKVYIFARNLIQTPIEGDPRQTRLWDDLSDAVGETDQLAARERLLDEEQLAAREQSLDEERGAQSGDEVENEGG